MTSKINIEENVEEVSLDIPNNEIEINDEDIYKTIDLDDVLEEVNEQI